MGFLNGILEREHGFFILGTIILRKMKKKEKITSNGYSHYDKKFYGWKLNPDKAFKYTDPEILARLDPLPNFRRMQKVDV